MGSWGSATGSAKMGRAAGALEAAPYIGASRRDALVRSTLARESRLGQRASWWCLRDHSGSNRVDSRSRSLGWDDGGRGGGGDSLVSGAGLVLPVGEVEALRLQFAADAAVADVEDEAAECGVGQVPVCDKGGVNGESRESDGKDGPAPTSSSSSSTSSPQRSIPLWPAAAPGLPPPMRCQAKSAAGCQRLPQPAA